MNTIIWKLQNEIKDYGWGSKTAITELFNIANPTQKPQAEIWMGAHPNGCSVAVDSQGQKIRLDELIKSNPEQILGENINDKFVGLPYLFKVLAAAKPLSIQVHPEKSKAQLGFAKENAMGIPLNAANRNYKDPNHKPELVYALTPYKAMNAFRPIKEIIEGFKQLICPTLSQLIQDLEHNPTPEQLKIFFQSLLTLPKEARQTAISELLMNVDKRDDEIANLIKDMAQDYPDDIGLFMPLTLNVIELKPGQAMYLDAETPHAYIQGTGMEIMANSDNVLRAGLTPKYIDVAELLDNTRFHSIPKSQLLTKPLVNQNKIDFPVPVDDFKFEIINNDEQKRTESVNSPEILFCLTGQVTVETSTGRFTIKPGESLFIAFAAKEYHYQGTGQLARAFN